VLCRVSRRRGPTSWAPLPFELSLALSALCACVATPAPEDKSVPACVATGSERAADAVVSVVAGLGVNVLQCSGIAIAPTLVVTSAGCVARPRSAGPPTESSPAPAVRAARTLIHASVDYDRICLRSAGWDPIEDGSLSARLGAPIDISALNVHVEWRDGRRLPFAVKRVITTETTSRCSDDIAILQLEVGLDVPAVAVRLDETTSIDEEVTLNGNCSIDTGARRRSDESRILSVTSQVGSELAPPRALVLTGEVSSFESGAAVLSRDSGALIAVIGSGFGNRCDDQDPGATSIAVRVSPFRRMLFSAAQLATETLRVEPGTSTLLGEELPTCPDGS
jgi:hypothetical protein